MEQKDPKGRQAARRQRAASADEDDNDDGAGNAKRGLIKAKLRWGKPGDDEDDSSPPPKGRRARASTHGSARSEYEEADDLDAWTAEAEMQAPTETLRKIWGGDGEEDGEGEDGEEEGGDEGEGDEEENNDAQKEDGDNNDDEQAGEEGEGDGDDDASASGFWDDDTSVKGLTIVSLRSSSKAKGSPEGASRRHRK